MSDKTELHIERLIKAPRDTVWKAWTDPNELQKWWCPRPWRTEIRKFSLKPGGAFDFVLHGPDGEKNASPCSFLDIRPKELIVFTSSLREGWQPAKPWLAITAFITLSEAAGGTLYAARVLHTDEAEAKRHDEMGFEEGWGTCLKQLAELVE